MLRAATLSSRAAAVPTDAKRRARRWRQSVLGAKGSKVFWLEPGADKKFTSIYWGEHMFDENMHKANENWTNPLPSSVPSLEDFGVKDSHGDLPPGAYPGINRKWVGFKPSKVTTGYYGGGLALRDTWGPDAEIFNSGGQARPDVVIDRVSVDFFLDEFSVPLNEQNTVMESCRAKHTNCLRLNIPEHDNLLDLNTLRTLNKHLQISTHALDRRITMVGACQNGKTEWFSKGLPLGVFSQKLRWLVDPPLPPSKAYNDSVDAAQVERLAEVLIAKRNVPNVEAESNELAVCGALHTGQEDEGAAGRLLESARKQAQWHQRLEAHQADPMATLHDISAHLREAFKSVYNLGRGDSPTISFVNGKAHNTGAGLALLTNYAALRDEAEITFSGAATGTTPVGGLTRLLRDDAVALKYPGLAEYITLTGDALYNGDAKRLGWTAVHAPTDIHLNERMLHDYMNMHGPGESGNARRILHSALFNDTDHSPGMDRCGITEMKAQWIKRAFDGKATVSEIMSELKTMQEEEGDLPTDDTEVQAPSGEHLGTQSLTQQQWAGYVHSLLSSYSPSALVVTLEMVHKARREQLDLAECMALEFRCFMKMIGRKDFIRAQLCIENPDEEWPVTGEWDTAQRRPMWEPCITQGEAARLVDEELVWGRHGATELELDVEVEGVRASLRRLGVEVVEGLGTKERTEDKAQLPDGVNVYKEARHPGTGVVGSAREEVPSEAQLEYRAKRVKEAGERIAKGEPRQFDDQSGAIGDYTETEVEREERLGKLRWAQAKLTATQLASPETASRVYNRIDVGGDPLHSPGGLDMHGLPFAPRQEPVYGDIPEYSSNILTHYYAPETGLPPKKIRDWRSVEKFHSYKLRDGAAKEDIARAVLSGDF